MDIKFKLPISRVFYAVKNGECTLLISNKNYTKFRTIEQLMKIEGETSVKCVDIDQIKYDMETIELEVLEILTLKKYLDKKGELKKRLKLEEFKDYGNILKKEEAAKIKAIGDANNYLKNIGVTINTDGTVVKEKENIQFENKNYFLTSGEPLNKVKNDHYKYFRSVGELLRYEQKLQEVKGKSVVSEERIQKNTEKYLESF